MLKRLALSFVVLVALAVPAAAHLLRPAVVVALFRKCGRCRTRCTCARTGGRQARRLRAAHRRGADRDSSTAAVVRGTKASLTALPFIAMGYSVVNVEPGWRRCRSRRPRSRLPMCAAVGGRAREGLQLRCPVDVAGASAGGHLALTTGMIPTSAGFDRSCQTQAEPHVAAIINFFGITDVADLLDGRTRNRSRRVALTVQWLGNQPNRARSRRRRRR